VISDDEVLAKIRREFPGWTVTRAEGRMWMAQLRRGTSLNVIFRERLTDLEWRIRQTTEAIQRAELVTAGRL
jgi:hypothetical protein